MEKKYMMIMKMEVINLMIQKMKIIVIHTIDIIQKMDKKHI